MKNKQRSIAFAGFMLSLMIIGMISAFAIGGDYWEDNPLSLGRGESKIVNLNAQNNIGDEDVTVKAVLTAGQEIASLSTDTYVVKAHSSIMVPLRVNLPKDAIPGDTKKISIEFRTVPAGNNGMVSMGTGSGWSFNVKVTEPVKKPINWSLWIGVIIVLVLIIIIIIVMIKKKNNKSNNRRRK